MDDDMPPPPLTNLELPGIKKLRSGKVREVFDLGETLLFVATDRISAFDCILPDPIPDKGAVLNQLSAFWFQRFTFVRNHMVAAQFNLPEELEPFRNLLMRRSMIVRKTEPLPVECVVRGYLAGSGWKEYQETGSVCGHRLPAGLELEDQTGSLRALLLLAAQQNAEQEEEGRAAGDDDDEDSAVGRSQQQMDIEEQHADRRHCGSRPQSQT